MFPDALVLGVRDFTKPNLFMADEYYSAPDSASASPGDAGGVRSNKPQGDNGNDEMEGDTALVPKSIFRGKIPEVGQDCTFHVEHLFEDEVELSWVNDKGEGAPSKKSSSAMDESMSAFDKMQESPQD